MKNKKIKIIIFLLIIYSIIFFQFSPININININIKEKVNDVFFLKNKVNNNNNNNNNNNITEFDLFFCPRDNCDITLFNFINKTETELKCAFFELNLINIIELLKEKNDQINIEILIDYRYKKYVENLSFITLINLSGLMHNKYCISDNSKILTGSFNPTNNCAFKNHNNVIIFESKEIAKNYLSNFNEIKDYKKPKIQENKIKNIKTYFCPGNCINFVSKEIRKAEHSVYFMTFSFTAKEIAIDIILKNNNNISVKGLFDNLQASSQYSIKHLFEYQNLDYKIIKGTGKLHHKVFIIDNKTVITGSFNPSANANNNNYENILVINDEDLAKKYIEEFYILYNNY
jgi:phosphatidylserine/phosphatidylglycerophosphate/cardiolipin synthase-like enzyme